jgi:3-hydroxybutyryl-CoA dehydrogenase
MRAKARRHRPSPGWSRHWAAWCPGKLTAAAAQATLARIEAIAELEQARDVGLVVEAIVEDLDIKRALLRQLEAIVAPDCVLASNTSSISITALAHGLSHPGRLVGMHFFNPVPVMKLVEVVSGLHTDRAVAEAIFALGQQWGKAPVHARSTPGFIVNRIARPYYAEALALLQEGAMSPAVLDACWRGAGFRMGPCELIDLIGHDTNFAVTQSVYQANFGDKRYMPSLLQREMVDGGLLGRKSGRGFYDYREGAAPTQVVPDGDAGPVPSASKLVVHGAGSLASRWVQSFERAGLPFVHQRGSDWTGLEADAAQLRQTDGRTATQLSAETGVHELAVADLSMAGAVPLSALAFSVSAAASGSWAQAANGWLRLAGHAPHRVGDAPGLVVARTVAMLINEASDAVHQGVCTAQGADTAMKLGVNYPAGPFEWLAQWDAHEVVRLLDHLDSHYRGERYRVSPALRQRAWLPANASKLPRT